MRPIESHRKRKVTFFANGTNILPTFSGAASRSPTNGIGNFLRRQTRPSEPLRYRRAHQIGVIESGNEDSEPLNFGYDRNRSYRASAISETEKAVSTQLMGAQAVQRHVGLLLFLTFSFKQRKSLSSPTERRFCLYFSDRRDAGPYKWDGRLYAIPHPSVRIFTYPLR